MSKRAEKYAHSTYPPFYEDGMYRRDNTEIIQVAIKAYEQAEKDLALTHKDLRAIHCFIQELEVEIDMNTTDIKPDTIGFYEAVLRKFNEWREKK